MEAGQTCDIAETPPANPAPSEFRRVDVSETGFTTLYDGSEKDGKDAIVDIIFVHGLGGNPETTWSTSKPSVHPADQPTLSNSGRWRYLDRIRSKPRGEKPAINAEGSSSSRKHETFWPAEFLPADFPCARILTWGYDSKVTLFFSGSVGQGSLYSHTKDLLYDVNDIRANNSRKRPIVWVAHSLGGIIVKEALLHAQSGLGDNSLKDIYDSTKQVLFLGTPHRGSSMASWGILAERFVKAAGFDTNAAILKQLTTQSPALGNLNERFISLLRSRDFDVVTFQEDKGMEGMRGLNGKVVEDFSSTIADERQRTIPGNHSEMCKFSSKQDTGYRRIEGELRRVIFQIQKIAGNGALAQAGRVDPDPLHEPQSLVAGQPQHLALLEQLMPEASIFGYDVLLHDAIKKGDEPTVRKLLMMGAKIEEKNLLFESDLSLAVSSGKVEIVDLLLEYGADIERRRPYSKETPLMEATKLRSYAIVKLLLQRGADSQSTDRKGNSSLHIACECGDEGLVNLLLQHRDGIEQRCFDSMDTPLLLATRSGQIAIVDLLVQRGAIIEAADSEGKTPLHLVSELRDDKMAKLLLKSGANPGARESRRQRTPLHYAAEKGNLAVARALLQSTAHIDTQDGEFGTAALHLAAELGHRDIVSLLIQKGAAVDVSLHASRTTPLHLASANGHDAVVKILLEAGADAAATQYPSLHGKTSLHLAAQYGHDRVVRLLCRESIVEKRDNFDGNTPLHLAAIGGHTLAAKILLEKNAEIEARNSQGSTALYLALKAGNEELALLFLNEGANTKWPGAAISPLQYAAFVGQTCVVQKLLELGVDVQDVGRHGEPALTCAASAGHTAIVLLLLSNKAELDSQNGVGYTALHQASRNGHGDTVRQLLRKGADFKLSDNIGRTALHDAASRGHEDVARILISEGADCTATDENFVTPLHLAAMSGHDNIIPLLIKEGAVIDALASGRQAPLAFACKHGHESTARALLAKGAKIAGPEITPPLIAAAMGDHLGIIDLLQSHRGVDGGIGEVEALLVAAYHGHTLVIKKLLSWGGLDINAIEPGGASALHFAATNGQDSAIRALLEEGADVDQRSDMDWLPIHGAALNGHTSAIRTLLNAGSGVECLQDIFNEDLSSLRRSDREGLVRLFVQFSRETKRFYTAIKSGDIASIRELAINTATANMRDANGNTALHAAMEYNCTGAIPILCDGGIGVNTKNALGRTALHDAVLSRNVEAQRLLLQYGSDVNTRDRRGLTALHAAVVTEQEVSVKILLEAGADIGIKDNSNQMNPLQYAEARGYEAVLPLLGKDREEYNKE